MLVISQKEQQPEDTVVITTPEGRVIEVCVMEVGRGRVKVGYTADRDIVILRRKLVQQGKNE